MLEQIAGSLRTKLTVWFLFAQNLRILCIHAKFNFALSLNLHLRMTAVWWHGSTKKEPTSHTNLELLDISLSNGR